MKYGFSRTLEASFEKTDQDIREALQEKGFGVVTEIDVQKTMREKLGIEQDKYKILGVCKPQFAHQAISAEKEIGLLLPCNVVIWQNDDKSTTVCAIDARKMLSIAERPEFETMADQVNLELRSAIEAL